jgi:hypothetical protein
MALSEMSSKEKTIVAILGAVILVALVGIGILVANLVGGGNSQQAGGVTVPPATEAPPPAATVTLVAPPSLEGLSRVAPGPISEQPVLVVRQEGVGPLAPVLIASQALNSGRRYRLEIAAADGSGVAILGSWGQSATSSSGQVAAPQIEFFEGTTPFYVDVVSPVTDPDLWSCSVSAGLKSPDVLGKSPNLVISIWDVTGTK